MDSLLIEELKRNIPLALRTDHAFSDLTITAPA